MAGVNFGRHFLRAASSPWVLTDASASDAGTAVHDAGLMVARRLIGRRQLITTENLLAQLAPRLEVPVLE